MAATDSGSLFDQHDQRLGVQYNAGGDIILIGNQEGHGGETGSQLSFPWPGSSTLDEKGARAAGGESPEDALSTFLAQFPCPVVESVVASALRSLTSRALSDVVRTSPPELITTTGDAYHLAGEALEPWRQKSSTYLRAMMRGAATGFGDWIAQFGRTPAVLDTQHDNIMGSVRWCADNGFHAETIRFLEYEKHLKWRGSKSPLYDLGTFVISAVDALPPPIPPWAMEAKARALVCTRAWIFQRTGRLKRALADGNEAIGIDDKYGFPRGMAFDRKCLGSLHRINRDFELALKLLSQALEMFQHGPVADAIEVGDTKALLARVYLERRDGTEDLLTARRLAQEAYDILVDHPESKDFADCNILCGDINWGNAQLARDYYEAVQKNRPGENVERGDEPFAAASMKLGELLERKSPSEAIGFFETARVQYERLEELETAALAEWRGVRLRVRASSDRRDQADLSALENASQGRRFLVRVRAWRVHEAANYAVRSRRLVASRRRAGGKGLWGQLLDQAEPWAQERIGPLW